MEFGSGELVPLAEALPLLGGMDRSTFHRYCKSGRLTKVKHANKVYVPRAVIDDYISRSIADAYKVQARNARSTRARRAG